MTKRWTKIDFFKVAQSEVIPRRTRRKYRWPHVGLSARVGTALDGPVRRLSAWTCDMRHMERAFL